MLAISSHVLLLCFAVSFGKLQEENTAESVVKVNKCCEKDELFIGNKCRSSQLSNESLWVPVFTSESGVGNVQVKNYQ